MDSKLKGFAIVSAFLLISLVIALVFYENSDKLGGKQSAVENQKQNVTDSSNLHAFLNDDTFFDEDPTEKKPVFVGDETPMLYMQASSVCKDIRIAVTDGAGKVVTGQSFFIEIDGIGDYKDVDKDGMIIIPDLTAGDYFVTLKPVLGYQTPNEPMRVAVKDQLEYALIDDIEKYIFDESMIDVSQEDTKIVEAKEEADETELTEIKRSDKTAFGIDVSKYQGEIDWARVKAAGVEFAIIRVGYRGSKTGALVEDPYFKKNLIGAKKAGIQVGVYFFTQAVNEVEAVEEASTVVALLDGETIDYPVFIDTEGAGGAGRADLLDTEMRTKVCQAFCKTIESTGLHSGVYASRNWYYNKLNASELESFVIWDAEYTSEPKYTGKYDMWQYTSSGMIDGINTRVDLDVSYIELN